MRKGYSECGEVRQEVASKEVREGQLHEVGEVTLSPSHFSPFLSFFSFLAFTQFSLSVIFPFLKLYPRAKSFFIANLIF